MANQENDDYQSDIRFGEWLRDVRAKAGLSIEDAAKKIAVPSERLKALELGYSEKGITKVEAERLCALYRADLAECLKRAQES